MGLAPLLAKTSFHNLWMYLNHTPSQSVLMYQDHTPSRSQDHTLLVSLNQTQFQSRSQDQLMSHTQLTNLLTDHTPFKCLSQELFHKKFPCQSQSQDLWTDPFHTQWKRSSRPRC